MDTWCERELSENEENVTIHEYDISSTPNDFNISTIFNLIDNALIKMPPFQRNYVWDKRRASKLIESILLGLPIPQIFLYEKGKDNFYVIDGQQRLLSIYFFVKQRFPKKAGLEVLREFFTGDDGIKPNIISDDKFFENFALNLPSPVETEKNKFHGLKYETLGEYKRTFDFSRTIRSIVIKQNAPDDQDSSMYEIFNRLNTGGQNLTSQEIRMSLFYSDFYKMLMSVNTEEKWRQLLGQTQVDLHFKDLEILVRAFAMLYSNKNYKASMTGFLNSFSKKASTFNTEEISYLKALFMSFLDSCILLSKEDFSAASGKFNISLFESVFVAACSADFEKKETIKKIIDKKSVISFKEDEQFIKATQDSIASKKSVTSRIKIAKTIISFN